MVHPHPHCVHCIVFNGRDVRCSRSAPHWATALPCATCGAPHGRAVIGACMHANKHISPWPFASHNEFGNGASHPSCAHGRAGADARGVRHTATALPLCAARAEPLVRAVIAVRKLHASSTLPMAKEQGMHQEGGGSCMWRGIEGRSFASGSATASRGTPPPTQNARGRGTDGRPHEAEAAGARRAPVCRAVAFHPITQWQQGLREWICRDAGRAW